MLLKIFYIFKGYPQYLGDLRQTQIEDNFEKEDDLRNKNSPKHKYQLEDEENSFRRVHPV